MPLWTVACCMGACVVCAGALLAWCIYLEYKPGHTSQRKFMLAVLAAVFLQEAAICWLIAPPEWNRPLNVLIAGTTFWGYLDALLRFPVLHDTLSFFALKQVVLLAIKAGFYAYCFYHLVENRIILVCSFLQCIVLLPLMYLLALPIGLNPSQQKDVAQGVTDVDFLSRLWTFLSEADSRRQCLQRCRRSGLATLISVAQRLPPLAALLVRIGPTDLRRTLRKGPTV